MMLARSKREAPAPAIGFLKSDIVDFFGGIDSDEGIQDLWLLLSLLAPSRWLYLYQGVDF
jgi:hypothetical protein